MRTKTATVITVKCPGSAARVIEDPDATEHAALTQYYAPGRRARMSPAARRNFEEDASRLLSMDFSHARCDVNFSSSPKSTRSRGSVYHPAGIYAARNGDHDTKHLDGRIRDAVTSRQVSINESIPGCVRRSPGGPWKSVVRNADLAWCAAYRHPLTAKMVYEYPASAHPHEKFDRARALFENRLRILAKNRANLKSQDLKLRQHATLFALLYASGARIGHESGKMVIGLSQLRPRHLTLKAPGSVRLTFLGKDSVPFDKEFQVGDTPRVMENLRALSSRARNRRIFPDVSADSMNRYINDRLQPGATCKVVRTMRINQVLLEALADGQDLDRSLLRCAEFANHKKKDGTVLFRTTLMNYIDPRLIVGYCKRRGIDPRRIYKSKSEQAAVTWALQKTAKNFKW